MSKYVKGLLRGDLGKIVEDRGIDNFIVINMMGIKGTDNNRLRGELREKGVYVTVVKNSLFRHVLKDREMGGAVGLFEGTCAIAYGGDSIVDVAKHLEACKKKAAGLGIKGAYLEGIVLDEKGAAEVSKMKSRLELQSDVAGIILSPGANLVGAILGPGSYIAGCVKSIIEKAEEKAA